VPRAPRWKGRWPRGRPARGRSQGRSEAWSGSWDHRVAWGVRVREHSRIIALEYPFWLDRFSRPNMHLQEESISIQIDKAGFLTRSSPQHPWLLLRAASSPQRAPGGLPGKNAAVGEHTDPLIVSLSL
jgi:hypothetical protein